MKYFLFKQTMSIIFKHTLETVFCCDTKNAFLYLIILTCHNVAFIAQVTMEKNELKEETSSLETQIEKLQVEIQARVAQSKPDLNVPPRMEVEPPEQTNFPGQSLQFSTVEPTLQQGPPAVLVVPFRPDLQAAAFSAPNVAEVTPKPSSVVSKPHARYPTPADSWPSLLLGQQPTSS